MANIDASVPGPPSPTPPLSSKSLEQTESVHEDDMCPVCHLLLYRPVKTRCNHTLCELCMAHWADVSVTTQMTVVSLDDEPTAPDAIEVQAKCPMCRTPTTASVDNSRLQALQSLYPLTYAARHEEEQPSAQGGTSRSIDTLTLYIGNTHRVVQADPRRTSNKHDWTFFVKPSRTDIVRELRMDLHPTFRPPVVTHHHPPYQVRRLGWGYFTITADVILKRGFSWVSDDAMQSPYGDDKGMLTLSWTLDFDGRGSQGRLILKFKSDEWVDEGESGYEGDGSESV